MGVLKDKIVHWTTGSKDGIGTALSEKSHVYFTIGKGRLTETYFPSPDSIVIHSITLFLGGKVSEADFKYSVEIPDLSAPFYKIYSKDVKKEIITNPNADALFIKYDSLVIKNVLKIAFPLLKEFEKVNENTVLVKTKTTFLFIHIDVPFVAERYENFILLYVNSHHFIVTISFGKNRVDAERAFLETKGREFDGIKNCFLNGWEEYIGKLRLKDKSVLYKRSIIAIKSMEDKDYKGATVASLAIPWGSKAALSEKNGYHLVWVRDLFFVAFAMYLAGDRKFTNDALDYIVSKLMRPDGSFKQNATIKGEERWNATQMDQVAFPIILASKIGRHNLINELEKSANYLLLNGPWSEQERWEEIEGFSPYSMSLQARALNIYAGMREKAGLLDSKYRKGAEEFIHLIPEYCYTHKGIYTPPHYFVRISKGDPDTDKKEMFLKGKYFSPKEMVSTDFLYLVFTGLYSPKHPYIKNSLRVIDNLLRADTPKGPSFYRYNGDIYGFDRENPKGRLWTLLTAERGIFELLRGNDAKRYLDAMERFATPTYLLPEQVFEDGTPTESATPLAWAHAAYIILYDFINTSFFNRKEII